MDIGKNEKVEKYLLNKMTESEKSAFQFELMQDENLHQEVKTMRRVQKNLIADSRQGGGQNSSQKVWKWILPLFFLPILFFLWKKPGGTVILPLTPKTEIAPPVVPVEKEEIKSEELEEETPIEEEIKKYAPKKQKNTETKDTEIRPQPIAMAELADLVPNPLFDQMMSGMRGGEIKLNLDTPSASSILTWQKNAFIFPFTGTIKADTDREPALQLLIFSNKKVDYENWEYLKKESLKITKSDEGFNFSVRPTLQLKRGLYYYLIENVDTEIPVKIGKFELR